MKVVDFSKINKPVLDDSYSDHNELDMNDQPEVVHAAIAAVQSMNIPNSTISFSKSEDGTIRISKGNTTLTPGGNSTLTYADKDVEIKNVGVHSVSNYIEIEPKKEGGYAVKIGSEHSGSYEGKIDASRGSIYYDVDANGKFTGRDGLSITEADDQKIDDQAHGKWVKDSMQTLESRFGRIMGPQAQADIDAQRPPTAATEVGLAPSAQDAVKLSTLNLSALANEDAAPVIKQAIPANSGMK